MKKNQKTRKNNQKKFNQICKNIKDIKIQGATDIVKAALYAYSLIPTQSSKKKLLSLRPTEPMLANVLKKIKKQPYREIIAHFKNAQEKINKNVLKIIKEKNIIFTHCHSTNVVEALIYAKRHGEKFEVYNTETRPLYQGRKTAKELKKAGIRVTIFIDSASVFAIEKENMRDKIYSDLVFLGADAILNKGIINKIGSKIIAELALLNKIPLYIIADSWKYTNKKVPIEQRDLNEVWNRAPKNIKIKNPVFEFVPKKYIRAVVSELGILTYSRFLRKVGN